MSCTGREFSSGQIEAVPALLVAGPVRARIFPLHLSPIEIFMLADDQPDYPMTFVIRLQLFGRIDRGAFEASMDVALQRHPLLRARIESGKGDRPCWVPVEQSPGLDWAAEGTTCACHGGEAIDLTKEIGLRGWVRQGPERAKVLLQFHHACCDGNGAFRFIGDLLARYGMLTAGASRRPMLAPLDLSLLRSRTQRALGLAATAARARRRLAMNEGWKILARRPAALEPPAASSRNGDRDPNFPEFLTYSFPRTELRRLRDLAHRCGATLNDLLLRDLFLALEQWNRQHQGLPGRRLRIMMPTDLRRSDDFGMPAANLTGYTFLSRRARDCDHPEGLLWSIRDQTTLIKHHRSGTAFMDTIFAASKVPWLLPFLLSRNFCLATAVLSNVSDPTRRFTARFPRQAGRVVSGNLVLEEIAGVPPLRRKTRATFMASQYDGRLSLGLRCDPQLFRPEDTSALMNLYAQHLRESASGA